MPETPKPCRAHQFVLTVDSGGRFYDACPRCRRLRLNGAEARMRQPRTTSERQLIRRLVREVPVSAR